MIPRLLASTAAGALLGAWLATTHGAAFVTPDPVAPSRWTVVVPGLDEAVVTQTGRGTQVVGGALVLTPHVFHRSDVLVPRDLRAIASVTMDLAPDSGTAFLRLRSGGKLLAIEVRPDAWRVLPGGWTPREGPLEVRVDGGQASIGGVAIGAVSAPTIELSSDTEPARIRALRLTDTAGEAFLVEDPVAAWEGRAPVAIGAMLGALAGAIVGLTGVGGLVAVAFPVAVALVPHARWLGLVERLYLVRLGPWELARAVLAASFLPLLVGLLARSGRAVPAATDTAGRDPATAILAWGTVSAVAGALASRGGGWALAPVGIGFLLAPLLLSRAARLDPLGLLVRDLPAAAVVAGLGWGVGLLGALVWRLVVLVSGAGALLRRAPRAASDAVFLGALALVPAAELAARSTWLDTAWDAARLEGDQAWRDPTPFWEGGCGPAPRRGVLYAGGSSTGGAYQFQAEPDAFYPSRIHARLCAAGASLRTTNHGDGGRDSFTVSRSIDALLAAEHPALVVVYVGVNDLLTQESPLTRAEREAVEEGRSAATRGFAALGAHSRLVTGLALLGRPRLQADAPVVPDVPLADAEVNLRRIATAARAAGAAVLLVPEHAEPETARQIAPYAALEARLAGELPGVTFVDTAAALAPFAGEGLLVDRNHLSRVGNERLAEVLAPKVAELAGLAGTAEVARP